jgi:GNAT superfamily N-acetyltransferase
MATTIRPATRADIPQILAFIRALAAYEHAPEAAVATEADLERDGFGPTPFYFCLIAEHDGQPAGFALSFFNYSTWLGRPGVYLEDLFVEPKLRGLGIGKALLQRVAGIAVEKGCQRMQWQVLDWNTPAVEFYRAMGGEFLDEWRNVRVGGGALKRLAGVSSDRSSSLGRLAGVPSDRSSSLGRLAGVPSDRSSSLGRLADQEKQQMGAPSFRRLSGERVGDQEPSSSPASSEAAR